MVELAPTYTQDDESDTSGHHVPKTVESNISLPGASKPDIANLMVQGNPLQIGVSNYLSKPGDSALTVQEPGEANDIISGHPFYYVKSRVNQ